MAIVSREYYTTTFMGPDVATGVFDQYNAFAQRAILTACMGRVTEANFATLYPFQQEAVLSAICAQISAYDLNGLDAAILGESSSGFTVGKVSVAGSGKTMAAGHASLLCPLALSFLEQAGLLGPAVATADGCCVFCL